MLSFNGTFSVSLKSESASTSPLVFLQTSAVSSFSPKACNIDFRSAAAIFMLFVLKVFLISFVNSSLFLYTLSLFSSSKASIKAPCNLLPSSISKSPASPFFL